MTDDAIHRQSQHDKEKEGNLTVLYLIWCLKVPHTTPILSTAEPHYWEAIDSSHLNLKFKIKFKTYNEHYEYYT